LINDIDPYFAKKKSIFFSFMTMALTSMARFFFISKTGKKKGPDFPPLDQDACSVQTDRTPVRDAGGEAKSASIPNPPAAGGGDHRRSSPIHSGNPSFAVPSSLPSPPEPPDLPTRL
jgi:hypothetical protein